MGESERESESEEELGRKELIDSLMDLLKGPIQTAL